MVLNKSVIDSVNETFKYLARPPLQKNYCGAVFLVNCSIQLHGSPITSF